MWCPGPPKAHQTTRLRNDLPASATVRVKIIALNGNLETPEGPEGEIDVQ